VSSDTPARDASTTGAADSAPVRRHLLVTNDFPPKVGGIQSQLWELWRRLPPDSFSVLTTPYDGDRQWDAQQPFDVIRTKQWWLLPSKQLIRQINSMVRTTGAEFVVLDPVVPLGLVGPKLDVPYVAIAHGAEYVIPGRLWPTRPFVRGVTRHAAGMIASGAYVERSVRRRLPRKSALPVISVPPGVDSERFRPIGDSEKLGVRAKFGIAPDVQLVVGVSRLVPRKGFDRLVRAAAQLKTTHPDLRVLIAGKGRERKRLDALIRELDAPVTMLGRVDDAELPGLYGAADIFCMPCHDRWMGLESEGFGIVFGEASAAGTAVVAGESGGSGEAVQHGQTGLVVPGQVTVDGVADALASLLNRPEKRRQMGLQGRERVVERFSYDHLAVELGQFLQRIPPAAK
jgi:phosphatidylinositol alpha-1,6-mannosyltransferase